MERAGNPVGQTVDVHIIMAFTKPSLGAVTAANPTVAPDPQDIWAVFRALRSARAHYGLRPAHLHSLQTLISFLKPGHGETVFASNDTICERMGGIDERTLRRHIARFVDLGLIVRQDSSNRKRYRLRSSRGEVISFGLSLAPLMARAAEFFARADEIDQDHRDRVFLRKQILVRLAAIEEQDPEQDILANTRRALRRKLSVAQYRALLAAVTAVQDTLSTAVDVAEPCDLSANDGQIVRHQSKSKKDSNLDKTPTASDPSLNTILQTCDQAVSFHPDQISTWHQAHQHAQTLAPMMGITANRFEQACEAVGTIRATSAIFILLQLGERVKNFGAYFHSITLGKRRDQFDTQAVLNRLAAA